MCRFDPYAVVLDTRKEAYRTHSGRTVYFAPGINGCPHFTYYEVTSREDMRKLERAAEAALEQIPEAKKITLHFMEKEVFHQSPSGSGYRGREKEIKTIVVKRERRFPFFTGEFSWGRYREVAPLV